MWLEEPLTPTLQNILHRAVEDAWTELNKTVKTTVQEVIGYEPRGRRLLRGNIAASLMENAKKLSVKNKAYRQYTDEETRTKEENYEKLRRTANKVIKQN